MSNRLQRVDRQFLRLQQLIFSGVSQRFNAGWRVWIKNGGAFLKKKRAPGVCGPSEATRARF